MTTTEPGSSSTSTGEPTVHQALRAVRNEVDPVRKTEVNRDQGFKFRGIDAVVNAAAPALIRHGVLVYPVAQTLEAERYETRGKALMKNVTVLVEYCVTGPGGDQLQPAPKVYGEAADAGDKAVSKAQSVAWRTCLLQLLQIPTGDRDPDADSHERSGPPGPPSRRQQPRPDPLAEARQQLWRASMHAAPKLTEPQRHAWIREQLTRRNLASDQPADLQRLTTELRNTDPWQQPNQPEQPEQQQQPEEGRA